MYLAKGLRSWAEMKTSFVSGCHSELFISLLRRITNGLGLDIASSSLAKILGEFDSLIVAVAKKSLPTSANFFSQMNSQVPHHHTCVICDTNHNLRLILQEQSQIVDNEGEIEMDFEPHSTLFVCSTCLLDIGRCSICFDPLLDKTTVDIECGCRENLYHKECIERYGKSTCPVCRQEMNYQEMSCFECGDNPTQK